mgnify:FL=1
MKNTSMQNKNFNKIYVSSTEDIKTTNINILLNRVKLNKKKDAMKKLVLSTFLISIFSTITLILLF